MSTASRNTGDPGTIVVVHQTGRIWRAVAGRLGGPTPVLTDSDHFGEHDRRRLVEWIERQGAGHLLAVLSADCVVCRNCTLPDAPPMQLEAALQLQAELHLPGIAPPHRQAMAVLDAAPNESTRSGILLAWPESATFDGPPTDAPLEYVPDIAALAALVNGERPIEPTIYVDRHNGAIAAAITHSGGSAFRATREDASTADDWREGLRRAMIETALDVGHTGQFVEAMADTLEDRTRGVGPDEAALLLPPDVHQSATARLSGAPDDEAWWRDYGIAAGVLLARAGDLAPLTTLKRDPPIEHPSLLQRTARRFASPAFAWRAIIAALVILVLSPLLFSGLRLLALQVRYGDLNEEVRQVALLRAQKEMYRELDRESWPMTKLLSDIVTNVPRGVDLEMIRLAYGQDFTANGKAKPNSADGLTAMDLVGQMQENLTRTGIFTEVEPGWDNVDNFGALEFSMKATIRSPYETPDYAASELDYAEYTLQERLYGREAVARANANGDPAGALVSSTTTEPPPAEDTQSKPAPTRTTPRPNGVTTEQPAVPATTNLAQADPGRSRPAPVGAGGTRGGADRSATEDRGTAAVPEQSQIPEPLTQEQVNAMTREELQAKMVHLSKVRGRDHPPEVQDRLREDWDMLIARLRELRNQS